MHFEARKLSYIPLFWRPKNLLVVDVGTFYAHMWRYAFFMSKKRLILLARLLSNYCLITIVHVLGWSKAWCSRDSIFTTLVRLAKPYQWQMFWIARTDQLPRASNFHYRGLNFWNLSKRRVRGLVEDSDAFNVHKIGLPIHQWNHVVDSIFISLKWIAMSGVY